DGHSLWSVEVKEQAGDRIRIETQLSGRHNLANAAQVYGLFKTLRAKGGIDSHHSDEDFIRYMKMFAGVKRRFEHLGSVAGIDIFEDFAHHPTAIALVIDGFRRSFPSRRLVVAFEPVNATGRRNTLSGQFAQAL